MNKTIKTLGPDAPVKPTLRNLSIGEAVAFLPARYGAVRSASSELKFTDGLHFVTKRDNESSRVLVTRIS